MSYIRCNSSSGGGGIGIDLPRGILRISNTSAVAITTYNSFAFQYNGGFMIIDPKIFTGSISLEFSARGKYSVTKIKDNDKSTNAYLKYADETGTVEIENDCDMYMIWATVSTTQQASITVSMNKN